MSGTACVKLAVCQPVAVSLAKVTWPRRWPLELHSDPTWVPVLPAPL